MHPVVGIGRRTYICVSIYYIARSWLNGTGGLLDRDLIVVLQNERPGGDAALLTQFPACTDISRISEELRSIGFIFGMWLITGLRQQLAGRDEATCDVRGDFAGSKWPGSDRRPGCLYDLVASVAK